ncbi:hypothetical protein [Cupriavidus necator]|uniref:hypothetical protein n=1 Tax=Cupriavidus necator TaxID=106590 RepID=UPI00339DA6F4
MNRPISAALRKLKSLACATSSANLIDQRFPKIEIPTKAMNLSKEQLLHAYQWDMKFMSEDDIPLASLLASLEHQHSIPTRERWQAALDFLYRLITCGLADITWVGEIERNLPKLYESLAKTPPLQLDPGYWLELQAYGTDKCIDLIKRHQIDWDSPLDPLFSKELEEMFIKQGVGIDQSPLVSIQF